MAIRENETGAGMGNESVPHFMLGGVAQYGTCVASSLVEGIVSMLFRLVGEFGPVWRAKEVEGHLPLDYSVRLGQG